MEGHWHSPGVPVSQELHKAKAELDFIPVCAPSTQVSTRFIHLYFIYCYPNVYLLPTLESSAQNIS